MKKYYLLLLFVTSFVNAQIVNIPDANFKAKLLSAAPTNTVAYSNGLAVKIDVNNDNEIQVSEALAIDKLNVDGAAINSLLGLEFFTNLNEFSSVNNPVTVITVASLTNLNSLIIVNGQLTNLDVSSLVNLINLNCAGNNLLNLEVSNLVNLTTLNCSSNDISTLNVTNLTNLTALYIASNNLSEINLNALTNLQNLYCGSNPITQLNLTGLINLSDLNCSANSLATIDLTPVPNLTILSCISNDLTTLNVSMLSNLTKLKCTNNLLTSLNLSGMSNLLEVEANNNDLISIDVTGNTNLKKLDVSFNSDLPSLDVSGLQMLEILNCSFGSLVNLNVVGCNNLKKIVCNNNDLTAIDLTTLTNLQAFECSQNLFVELDFSNCPLTQTYSYEGITYGQQFSVSINPNLVYINLKNGTSFANGANSTAFGSLPNLQYVCLDEAEMSYLSSLINSSVNVNTYCSFVPGGDYNTISGLMKFDSNSNGCDASDLPQPNIKININDGTNQGATFTNNSGNYSFFTQTGIFNVNPSFENPSYFNFSPTSTTIPFTNNDNNVATQNFCITANGVHPDLEIVIVPIIPARPGFDAVYKIVYKNKGNQTVTGYVNFTYNDAVLDFVSSSVVPGNNGNGFMNWVFPNLAPFQVGSILVTLNVNSPQETPAINIDDVLAFNAFIDVSTDDIWADNNFDFSQIVVGSYDPNDITCLQGNSLPTTEMGTYLHYNIRFENTGTAPAENIVVTSEIDLTQYNLQSLQVMESSHPMEVKLTGNIAEFIFQTINLDTGGHGNILLKMKSNNALSNNYVMNSADIFFDYNFPIETNDEQTVFADLSKNDFNKDLSLQIYPNPTSNIVTIKSDSTINAIQVYDAQGRLLITKMTNDNLQTIDLSPYATGIYYLSVSTTSGKQTQKVIKQ